MSESKCANILPRWRKSSPGIYLPDQSPSIVVFTCPLVYVTQEGVAAAHIPSLHARFLHDDRLTSRVRDVGSVGNHIGAYPFKVRGWDTPVVCKDN